MRYSLTAVLLLIFNISISAMSVDSLRTEKRGDQWVVIHQVDAGETLYAIARRYNADVNQVIKQNEIENNAIQIGQLLEIPVNIKAPNTSTAKPTPTQSTQTHTVTAGETLYGVSRKYNVKVEDIVAWNDLTNQSLNIGQVLKINGSSIKSTTQVDQTSKENSLPFPRAQKHHVQVGETVSSIASKRNISEDSLRAWNKLNSNNISIGQTLWYRTYVRTDAPATSREVFGKRIEEGIAMQIEDMEDTEKYLALHKNLPIGTLVEIRNLMNNKKVFVRVVGQLPNTGINQDVIVRLTSRSFKRLGILDARARVELTYYEEK